MKARVGFTVFTKPWPEMRLPELGRHVRALGFDGVELPVRPGFQVQPENVARDLRSATRVLADCGVKIGSVAGPTDEATIAACGAAGVPIIRICVPVGPGKGYLDTEKDTRKRLDELVGPLERHGVTIGIQNHSGRQISSAAGLRRLVENYDPAHVAAVLDFGHSGLAGEPPDLAIDAVWSHLCLVNLKSAYWLRSEDGGWQGYWVGGREGMADWAGAAAELRRRNYRGDVCLTAQYSETGSLERLVADDIDFAKSLFT